VIIINAVAVHAREESLKDVLKVFILYIHACIYTNVEGYTYVFISSTSGLTSTCSVCSTVVLVPGVHYCCAQQQCAHTGSTFMSMCVYQVRSVYTLLL
jgi:hypothetical protein